MLKTVAFIIFLILFGLAVPIFWLVVKYAFETRPRRKREPGFEYIYVEDYGSARELDAQEREYLNTKFHGGDGNRPYIKTQYESLTPNGLLRGYLRRRQLPKDIPIHPKANSRIKNAFPSYTDLRKRLKFH